MKQKHIILISFLFFLFNFSRAQNKYGIKSYTSSVGTYLEFQADSSLPKLKQQYSPNSPCYATLGCTVLSGQSNICDSATGALKFLCTSMVIWDSNGSVMENGDSLQWNMLYQNFGTPGVGNSQSSLILPKGNDEYYVFIGTVTDTTLQKWGNIALGYQFKNPFDQLLYNVVDMKLNNGMGKVVKKKIPLLQNKELGAGQMMACKHANGKDWWLLKHDDSNGIYRFLVKSDTIEGPYFQQIPGLDYGRAHHRAQSNFSPDGSKYVSARTRLIDIAMTLPTRHPDILIADFDRNTGELKNALIKHLPKLNTGWNNYDTQSYANFYGGNGGSLYGATLSPNKKYVYITTPSDVLQYEYLETDSAKAWKPLFHYTPPLDHNYPYFSDFNGLYNGPDGRIYIGQFGGSSRHMSYIDQPDLKGDSASFCWICLVSPDTNITSPTVTVLISPSTMPNYNLGPLVADELPSLVQASPSFDVYPNPARGKIKIVFKQTLRGVSPKLNINNSLGASLYSVVIKPTQQQLELDTESWPRGMYILNYGGACKKLWLR